MYQNELNIAKSCAIDAGKAIKEFYKSQDLDVTYKGKNQPLTDADLAANRIIKEAIQKNFPQDGWLSEEDPDSEERFSKSRLWIVDPLDGTSDFIKQNPEFAVSIGLVENGEPVLGVIYQPITKELFWGAKGVGAFLNDKEIQTKGNGNLKDITVLASQSEFKRGEWDVFKGDFQIKPTGGTAFKLALVASGRAESCFTLQPKSEWDICAGHALLNLTGGKISTATGEKVEYNQKKPLYSHLLYSQNDLHQPLLDVIKIKRPDLFV